MAELDDPEVLEEDADAETGASLSLQLTPIRLTLSTTKVIVNWRLSFRNTGDNHIIALRIWSDLTTAKRSAIHGEEAGKPDMDRARLHQFDKVEPGGEGECSGEWQMSRDEAMPVKTGHVQNFKEPRVLPIARFRLIGAGIPPTFVSFAMGSPAETDGVLPDPLLFDDRMQIFADLAAVQLD